MPAQITAGGSQRAGIRTAVLGTYRRQYEAQTERLSQCMDLDFPSDTRSEFYFYWEAAPHLGRWGYGGELPFEGFRGIQFEVSNHRWAKAISWQADDEADDQTRDLINQARGLGQSAATLDERIFFQIINGTADNELLPTVPNAPDGTAVYNAADAVRFGVTDGNLVEDIAAPTTAAGCRSNYHGVIGRFADFQDTKGQPHFDPGVVEGPLVWIGNTAQSGAILGAFMREERVADSSAGVSDEIRGAGRTVIPWITQRATADEANCFLTNAPVKAVFSQLREPLAEVAATDANSDRARESDENYIRFKMRKGFGAALPLATCKVVV